MLLMKVAVVIGGVLYAVSIVVLVMFANIIRKQELHISLLLKALGAACARCGRCHGEGRVAIAGGWISCPLCSEWRRMADRVIASR